MVIAEQVWVCKQGVKQVYFSEGAKSFFIFLDFFPR